MGQFARMLELIRDAGALGPIRFEQEHPHPVLVPETVQVGEMGDAAPRGGSSGTMVIMDDPGARTTKIFSARVLLVRKEVPDPTDRWIKIGRIDADVMVNDFSVSNLHARIRQTGRRSWLLEDLDSKNGTLLDGSPVPPHEPVPMESGQLLQLGRVILTFLDPAGLYKYMTEVN